MRAMSWRAMPRRAALRRTWLAAGALLLAGCAAPTPAPDASDDALRATLWRGRFAVNATEPAAAGDAPRQDSATGSFALRRVRGSPRDALALELYSPLGQTVASASVDPSGARIELADGRQFEAADPDLLTEQSFGWRLPLSRLTDWLEGRADGAAERDAAGRLVRATDSNWRVTVTDWNDRLPRRLELDWPVDPVQPPRAIRLRLVIDAPPGQ
jgi:outer membrane lipoprotein LolB